MISDLRVVKRTNINDLMNICYDIKHLFHVVLNYCSDVRPINDCIPEASNQSHLSDRPDHIGSVKYMRSTMYILLI